MVLNEIAWAFKNKHYANLKEFNKDVQQYQIDILGDEDVWKPNEVVADAPQVEICYEAWIKSPRDLLKNETLTVPIDEVFNDEVDEDEYQNVEIIAQFDADNGANFTAAELLLKIHNAMVNKELGDNLFFEGIEELEEETAMPSYYVVCGS